MSYCSSDLDCRSVSSESEDDFECYYSTPALIDRAAARHRVQMTPSFRPPLRGVAKDSHDYRGQLEVELYEKFGLLTVNVIGAKDLLSTHNRLCDSFITLSLDPEKCFQCKTETVLDSNSPTFNAKYTIELFKEDLSRRVCLAVWNRLPHQRACELLGCVAFSIKHIVQKNQATRGWYHLMDGDAGKQMCLPVRLASPALKATQLDRQASPPHTNTESLVIFIPRGQSGFGFSVAGTHPVTVGRVHHRTTADLAGLENGDVIKRINGRDVSSLDCESVAALIKCVGSTLVLQVDRQVRSVVTSRRCESHGPIRVEEPIYESISASNLAPSPCVQHNIKRVESEAAAVRDEPYYFSLHPSDVTAARCQRVCDQVDNAVYDNCDEPIYSSIHDVSPSTMSHVTSVGAETKSERGEPYYYSLIPSDVTSEPCPVYSNDIDARTNAGCEVQKIGGTFCGRTRSHTNRGDGDSFPFFPFPLATSVGVTPAYSRNRCAENRAAYAQQEVNFTPLRSRLVKRTPVQRNTATISDEFENLDIESLSRAHLSGWTNSARKFREGESSNNEGTPMRYNLPISRSVYEYIDVKESVPRRFRSHVDRLSKTKRSRSISNVSKGFGTRELRSSCTSNTSPSDLLLPHDCEHIYASIESLDSIDSSSSFSSPNPSTSSAEWPCFITPRLQRGAELLTQPPCSLTPGAAPRGRMQAAGTPRRVVLRTAGDCKTPRRMGAALQRLGQKAKNILQKKEKSID